MKRGQHQRVQESLFSVNRFPQGFPKLEADKEEVIRVRMAYSNRKIAYTEVAYPELQPITERQVKRQPIRKSQYKKKTTRAEYILFMAVNAALVFGMFQCARALVSDSFSLTRLTGTQVSVQKFFSQTKQENRILNDKIRIYSSTSGIEELARNYLNMVGENELPVRFQ